MVVLVTVAAVLTVATTAAASSSQAFTMKPTKITNFKQKVVTNKRATDAEDLAVIHQKVLSVEILHNTEELRRP